MNGSQEIEHVVVLMLENRSFDNILGNLYSQDAKPHFIYAKNAEHHQHHHNSANSEHSEMFYGVHHLKNELRNEGLEEYEEKFNFHQTNTSFPYFGPGEFITHVATQLYNKTFDEVDWNEEATLKERMDGTIRDYTEHKKEQFDEIESKLSDEQKKKIKKEKILSCFSHNTLPIINSLASEFGVSDYWFASVPSQTWPNRCFLHSGSSAGVLINEGTENMVEAITKIHFHLPESVFTSMKEDSSQIVRCNADMKGLTWSLHCNLIDQFHNRFKLRSIDQFKEQCENDSLPAYTFIEPYFFNTMFHYQDDQHPLGNKLGIEAVDGIVDGLSVNFAEELILKIYKYMFTLPQNDISVYKKRLFIILYDENGGNFDHIFPPKCSAPPLLDKAQVDFEFERLGVRVPAIFISPLIEKHSVLRSENKKVGFDHTSLIKSLISRFGDQFDDDKKQKFLENERISNAPEFWPIITPTTHKTTHDLLSIYDNLKNKSKVKESGILKKIKNKEIEIDCSVNQRTLDIIGAERMKYDFFASKIHSEEEHTISTIKKLEHILDEGRHALESELESVEAKIKKIGTSVVSRLNND